MATPQHKKPCIGDHELYNCGRGFLGHHFHKARLGSELYETIYTERGLTLT